MRSKKKLSLLLSTILCALCLILGLAACGDKGANAKEAIAMYILPQNETLVDNDFTLPKKIGKNDSVSVKWESDKPAAIAIEDAGETYQAKVTLQNEVTDVKLTISAGGASKSFTVRVDELSVYTFLDNYHFPQLNAAVKAEFTLDTSMTYQGKTATIAWDITDEASKEYISLNAEKNKVSVVEVEELKAVKIAATFTFEGESATQSYSFNVAPPLEHLQIVNRMYSEEGYPVSLSGYIVHLVEASESYGNATFYMIDDDFCSGYYLYRVSINAADIAKYVEGAHVSVSAATAKNYNGLWENNSNGTAVVDDEEPINPRDHVYALDTDLLAGAPSMLWRESTLVSLSGWKVLHKGNYNNDSKTYVKPTAADQNLFTLEKNGTEIVVRITKYAQRTDEELAALLAWYDSVNEGEFINVTGLLGNYNAFQIQPLVASDITKADAESTNVDAPKVKAAIDAVAAKVEENFASLVMENTEVTMPTSEQGVTISYRVAGSSTNATVAIDGGKITVTPADSRKAYDIEVTYSIGDYKAYSFFTIQNQKANADAIVQQVLDAFKELKIDDFYGPGQIALPSVEDLMGTTVTWKVKDAEQTWVKIEKNNLTVAPAPADKTKVTLKVTVSMGEVTKDTELSFYVHVGNFKALEAAPENGGEFYLSAMHYGQRLYVTGTDLEGGYLTTTDDVSKAAKLTLEKSGNNWLIKFGGKYLEINPYNNSSNNVSYNLRLVASATAGAVWEWDSELKLFKQKPKATEEGVTPADAYYYIGMRDNATFTTMSPSAITYITGNNAGNLNVVQHPAYFGGSPFTQLTSAQAGTFKFAMYNASTKTQSYATGKMSGNYFATTEDASKAADFVLEAHGTDGYTIKIGDKYLEFEPRTSTSAGVNIVLKDAPTSGKYWKWNEAIKNFVFETTYNNQDDANATDLYYLGTYGTYDTMSGNYIGRIATKTGDNYTANGKEGVDQWVAHFGTLEINVSTQPAQPSEPETETASSIKLTYTSPAFGKGYNETEMTGVAGGVTFGWIGVMANTYEGATQNSIQGRSDKNSVLYTKTALPKSIKEIKVKMKGTNGFANTDVFIASFATSYEGLATAPDAAKVHMNTVKDQTEYTITAPSGNWTFLQLKWGDSHASYWDYIEIVFND